MGQHGSTTAPHDHAVTFYDVEPELAATVARYADEGLAQGGRVLLVATRAHQTSIDAALLARGANPFTARASGRYVTFDAEETLSMLMVDGSPDPVAFRTLVGGAIAAARADGSRVRAFGEMVALLWDDGNVLAALGLEALWNDLARTEEFELLCGYPSTTLDQADLGQLDRVCQAHSAVLPPASYGAASSLEADLDDPEQVAVFVAVPEAVSAARRFVTSVLQLWGQDDIEWEATLLVSELATNALLHSSSPFRVSLRQGAGIVRLAVEDAGHDLPEARSAGHDALDGRGMTIVDQLSYRCGFDRLPGGKVSWAELVTPYDATG